jgi:outer membrane receptor for ferrienterochelin and colicins
MSEHFSQRFSYGLGYRAPLTFFESQHGNQENGYEIGIKEIEKAHSAVYSISYNTPDYYLTSGVHYTHLQNMAYGLERQGQATLYENSSEDYDLWTSDFLTGYRILPWWFLEGSIEFFKYQNGYTRKLPTAAIEQRFQLKSSIESGKFNHQFSAIFVGSRDLSRYGRYDQHYVDRDQSGIPEPLGSQLKNQKAPAFVTFDTSLTYRLRSELNATLGITNILDYTQAGQGDNPSAWHRHFTHSHFDGLHTWGPNRGREIFFQLSAEI